MELARGVGRVPSVEANPVLPVWSNDDRVVARSMQARGDSGFSLRELGPPKSENDDGEAKSDEDVQR